MSGAVVAVSQWLVRATDDRVVTASNPVRLPHIAWGTALPVSFGDTIRPSVPSIMVSMMGDVNIGVDAAKAACWSTRDREARRLELTPGAKTIHVFRFEHVSVLNSQSVLRNDVTSYCLARWVWDLFWVEFVFFFIVLAPGSDSVRTSLLTSMHFCVRTVIAHQCLLRPLLNCWFMLTICCSFLCSKKWLN